MANLAFDFNKIKRTYFNVAMKDGTKLQVMMPKKRTFEKVKALTDLQQDENADISDVVETLAGVMADCLSNNMNKVEITPDQVASQYDIEEMTEFIGEYYNKFVGGIQSNPN